MKFYLWFLEVDIEVCVELTSIFFLLLWKYKYVLCSKTAKKHTMKPIII